MIWLVVIEFTRKVWTKRKAKPPLPPIHWMRSKFGNALYVQWDTVTAQKKKTPNFKRKPSISTAWRQHLGLIVLSSTHDWRHASVVISKVQSIVTSFKAQLGSFCIHVGSFSPILMWDLVFLCIHVGSISLYTCGVKFSLYTWVGKFSLYRCGIVLPV